MKKLKSANEIISEYIEYATIEGQTKLDGDYKTGNRMVKKLNKLCEQLKADRELATYVLNYIMDSDHIRAKGLAAGDALRMRINIDKALDVLQRISQRDELGIWAGGAKIALKIWNEKGYLDP
jgi:hypothetical protein